MVTHLSEDEQRRVTWVLAWTSRMAGKYGGTVYDQSGQTWDWGQALCRECYGADWNNAIVEQGIETPTWDDIGRANRWEQGELPDWFINKPQVKEGDNG